MLRPGELCALTFGDLSFTDINGINVCFVAIGKPKMRRIGPWREHVRLDDEEVIQALRRWGCGRAPEERLCSTSSFHFALNFRLIMQALRLPTQQGIGMTPACLRSGGATFWYHVTDSTEYVRYRGRWANTRMLEVYI